MLGREQEGVRLIVDALSAYRADGSLLFVPFFLLLLAEAFGMTRNPRAALEQLNEAVDLVANTKERWCEAELRRVKGELSKLTNNLESAQTCFSEAIVVARRQNARFFELRAAMSMARLWRDQGKRDEARDLLTSVYGWFTEGFDTLDLKEAKALLEELAA
jgi:predicted ATPase